MSKIDLGIVSDFPTFEGNTIRYNSGLQICSGSFTFETTITDKTGEMYYSDGITSIGFTKSFLELPNVVANVATNSKIIICGLRFTKGGITAIRLAYPTAVNTPTSVTIEWIAKGRWK